MNTRSHRPRASIRRYRAPLVLSALVIASLASTGCAQKSYYAITEPESGRVHYTRKINEKPGGDIRFMDKETGARVRLSKYEIEEISPDDYRTGIRNMGK